MIGFPWTYLPCNWHVQDRKDLSNDQSDQLNGVWNIHLSAQKFDCAKNFGKISSDYK